MYTQGQKPQWYPSKSGKYNRLNYMQTPRKQQKRQIVAIARLCDYVFKYAILKHKKIKGQVDILKPF